MSYRFRAILIITAVFTLLAPASAALATDNTTPWYKKGRQYYYYIHAGFPAGDWRLAVREAGKAWSDRTVLKFNYAGLISSSNPSDGSTKIVWRGSIPSAWRANCPPDETLACTRLTYYTTNNAIIDGHRLQSGVLDGDE